MKLIDGYKNHPTSCNKPCGSMAAKKLGDGVFWNVTLRCDLNSRAKIRRFKAKEYTLKQINCRPVALQS